MYRSPLPKAAAASDCAALNNAGSSSAVRTMRMPRPPPPAEALTIMGNPTCRAHSSASPSDAMTPSEPGRIGTPAFLIAARAFSFSPMSRVISGGGPMNLMPQVSHTSAKLAFSASRPYPGWIASTLAISAALITAGMFR